MKKAVIYARYSSDNQRDESIDAQVRACQYYAQKNDLDIVHTYADRAVSGTSTKGRNQFAAMLEDSASGDFDTVLVHTLSRFARDTLDMLTYKQQLEYNGVQLVSVREQLDSTPEGRLMLMVIAGMNEFYSANLAKEVMKGLNENALKAKHCGGFAPLGFSIDPDTRLLVINEREAEAVRIMYKMYANGHGYGEIAQCLNDRGYRTKKGAKFNRSAMHDTLRNEKYAGVYVYGRMSEKDRRGVRNRHKFKDEYTRIENGCPAIVDRELWERVRKQMELNKRAPARNVAKSVYLLSGKLYCGNCGRAMLAESRTAKGLKYFYYLCDVAKRQGADACCTRSVRKERAERLVIDTLANFSMSEDNVNQISHHLAAVPPDPAAPIRAQLEKTNRRIENIVDAIADGLPARDVKDKMEALTTERDQLQAQLANTLPIKTASPEEIRRRLLAFLDIKKLDERAQKEIIQEFVERVNLFNGNEKGDFHIEITLNPANLAVAGNMARPKGLELYAD